MVSDLLQAPIRYGKTSKGAWDELKRVHTSNDLQRKFALIRSLYRLEMTPSSTLIDHERRFDTLVQSLTDIGKNIETEDLIVVYSNPLS
jgi:hypothetical protein